MKMQKLIQTLQELDNKSYKGYKRLQGHYDYDDFRLYIDYVQGDPFASPSKIRAVIPQQTRKVLNEWLSTYPRRIAAEDAFARAVAKAVHKQPVSVKGSGKSGQILFDGPGQEILERTAVMIEPESITVCLSVGLPANGRRINGREAEKLFKQAIPSVIEHSILTVKDKEIGEAMKLADQQDAVREAMQENGWVAFIKNGSVLPRKSGISNKPLENGVPFRSPAENEVTIDIPHQSDPVIGMAINKGITLIVGGGYHGKSTLLTAIERGVYPHVAGDGREFVLTDPDAVKIRAEDGRQVTGVNISPFINQLPHKADTSNFSTENASGSTSQAANVMESLEAGAKTLLIDEDTSATNFMIRDHRMQKLVQKDKEPITPFIDKISQLYKELDVSTILVMGGSGDYFQAADTVIMLDEYVPYNVTSRAKEIIKEYPLQREETANESFGTISDRYFKGSSFQTQKGNKSKTQAKGLYRIVMGKTDISFDYTEQLIDSSQTRMIAEIIQYLDRKNGPGNQSLNELLDTIEKQVDNQGLASFTTFKDQHPGDLARPRRYEISAVLNRMRTAVIEQR